MTNPALRIVLAIAACVACVLGIYCAALAVQDPAQRLIFGMVAVTQFVFAAWAFFSAMRGGRTR